MFTLPRAAICVFTLLLALLPFSSLNILAQKPQSKDAVEKLTKAVERSKKAAEVLRAVAALPDGKGIPKEVTEKMNMFGIVPDAFQLSLLFSRGVRGYGITAIKQNNKWSLPAYYFYGKSNGLDLSSIGKDHFDIIMIVVNAELPTDKAAAKPDKSKKSDKDKAEKPQLYVYALANGNLKQINRSGGFLSGFLGVTNILYDDSINKAVYGSKGDDILLGKAANPNIPPELVEFQRSLDQLFPDKN